ncbi:alcohol dehydrogenase-like [Drosophila ficusphila]|uniref:alcohol dehydrogenase-like n=1 Tax=Drosophila ficusphila TaxID=30025 RepID=UPI0007E74E87|nr:alcohol dehydrogenase-like [Drosophila ficusphila]
MDLTGKNVVYLGGFGGIGQKCVQELLQRPIKALAIFDLAKNADLLAEWKGKHPNTDIFYQKVDITKKSDIDAAYKATAERFGHFDVVVNGSGLMNDRLVELSIQINLLGVINSTLTALEYMDKAKGGKGGLILNISSVAGLQPTAIMAIYSAAKTGVTTFTRALANPFFFAHSGVGFVTICPGFTDTGLLEDIGSKTTFTYETPMLAMFNKVKRQKAEDCARNLVLAIETAKNGDVLMIEDGKTQEIDMPVMWKPTFVE